MVKINNCSAQDFALAAKSVRKRSGSNASTQPRVWFLHGLMPVTMKVLNETVSIPQLSWGNNRCKWR